MCGRKAGIVWIDKGKGAHSRAKKRGEIATFSQLADIGDERLALEEE